MKPRNYLNVILTVVIVLGACIFPVYAVAVETASQQKISSVLQSNVFTITESRYVVADRSATIDSVNAIALRTRFDRFFSNDLVGVYLAEYTSRIAIKPADGVSPAAMLFNAESNTRKTLDLNKVDKNGFWIFEIPAEASAPLNIIISNGKLVSGAKPSTTSSATPNVPAATVNADADTSSSWSADTQVNQSNEKINWQQRRNELLRLINAERKKRGMHALETCPTLMEFAQERAIEGGYAGGDAHTRPNGDRIHSESWSGATTARGAFDGWMNSRPHREPMLGVGDYWANVDYVGVGVGPGGSILIFQDIRYTEAETGQYITIPACCS